MANDCAFSMMAVSSSKVSLELLVDILHYNSAGWYIYRVRETDADKENIFRDDNGLFTLHTYGDVAWGCSPWVTPLTEEEKKMKMENGAAYTNLIELSRDLNISFEIFAEECGMAFAEYIHISGGKLIAFDRCDYEDWLIEDEVDLENALELLREHNSEMTPETREALEKAIWNLKESLENGGEYCGFPLRYGSYEWTHHDAGMIEAGVPLPHPVLGVRMDE